MKKIDVIILAGGRGTRLRSVVNEVPKVLAPVKGRPFLDFILEKLNNQPLINNVVIAVGYMAEKIIERYRDTQGYDFDILFSLENKLLGTGGAIKKALIQTTTKNVMVLNGDSYIDIDIDVSIKRFLKQKNDISIVLKYFGSNERLNRYGTVNIDDNNKIISFFEKSTVTGTGYINAGMYLFNRVVFKDVHEDKVLSFENDLIPDFVDRGIYALTTDREFIDIGVPETYQRIGKFFDAIKLNNESHEV